MTASLPGAQLPIPGNEVSAVIVPIVGNPTIATPVINTDGLTIAEITGLDRAITSMSTNLSGTPTDEQAWLLKITDNGTARAITWGSAFTSYNNVALPTTTVAGVTLRVWFGWDSVVSKWYPIAVIGGTAASSGSITPSSPDDSVTIGGTGSAPTFQIPQVFWVPSDNGLLAANYDPANASGAAGLTAGKLYLARFSIHADVTISNLLVAVATAGSGASTTSFAGLYSSAGALLTGSSDIGSLLTSTGVITLPLTTPQAIAAGSFVWAAICVNLATTQPTLRTCGNAQFAIFANQTGATARAALAGTGHSSLPASITPSSNTLNDLAPWVGAT